MTALTIPNSLISVISKSSTLLASILGSPLAGIGISLLANAFGVDKSDTQKLLEAIQNDSGSSLKIKEIEFQNKLILSQLASQAYATEVDDRKNARQREISLRDFVPTILAIGFLFNYAAIQFYYITHNTTVNDIISARFQDVLIMIMSYYFGSSHKEINH